MKSQSGKCLSVILHYTWLILAFVFVLGQTPAHAGTSTNWFMGLGAYNGGAGIGVFPGARDGWDGGMAGDPNLYPWSGVALVLYRQHSSEWGGDTGFYDADYESPVLPGTSKTWSDFYLWSHDYTPDPPGQIEVGTGFEASVDEGPPPGYRGHLVIDQVAAGVTWTGPMDYWFDMTKFNTFVLPIANVSDPFQGTRFHLTVCAPAVPEPSSILPLGFALAGMGVMLRRRR